MWDGNGLCMLWAGLRQLVLVVKPQVTLRALCEGKYDALFAYDTTSP